jgi:DNA-binding MarR family transcriptional regulator
MSNPAGLTYEVTHEVRDGCLCLHAQRAARLLARRFDAAFRPLGLTSGQFSLMMSLNRPEPATLGAVSGRLGMDRTTRTAALKPLERRGLVAAAPGKDRRSRGLLLTDAGRALLAAAVPIWRAEHAALDAMLAEGGDGDLAARLGRLTDGLAGVRP